MVDSLICFVFRQSCETAEPSFPVNLIQSKASPILSSQLLDFRQSLIERILPATINLAWSVSTVTGCSILSRGLEASLPRDPQSVQSCPQCVSSVQKNRFPTTASILPGRPHTLKEP